MWWVVKNTKTGEYSDGNFNWTMKLEKARRYWGENQIKSHDHIGFVPYEKEKK